MTAKIFCSIWCACELWRAARQSAVFVQGYHVYQRIWDAAIGEVLDCDREPDNAVDHYAVKLSSCLFNLSYLFVDTTNGGSAQRLRQAPFWVRKLTCSMNLHVLQNRHFRPRVCSWRLKIFAGPGLPRIPRKFHAREIFPSYGISPFWIIQKQFGWWMEMFHI